MTTEEKERKWMLSASTAEKVNWLNLPRAIALSLFTITDTLIDILEQLQRLANQKESKE